MSPRIRLTAALLSISLTLAAPAAAQSADTIPPAQPVLESGDLVYAAGAALATLGAARIDRPAADFARTHGQNSVALQRASHIAETIAIPGAFIIGGGLYVGGKIGDDDGMADAGLHTTEAVLIASALSGVLKFASGRARPYVSHDSSGDFQLMRGLHGDRYRSFPSGHTVIAFAMAAAATQEVDRSGGPVWLVGAATYSGATLVGLARMYHDMHWASDVVMGAAIGVFTGRRVVQWQHSHPGNRVDRWLLGVSVRSIGGGERVVVPFVMPVR
jgi:membrane-associated phospholipid phosphatase